jgi:branched-chain amino acid aminotransferase
MKLSEKIMTHIMDIPILLCKEENKKQKPDDSELTFGKIFTDHMFFMHYRDGKWQEPRIIPYQPFEIDPACSVLHYSQEIFEGMKAFPHPDGSIHMFRPYDNAERMNLSAERMCMPKINKDLFVNAITQLIRVDKEWVPSSPGTSLYIRPTMIASETFIGLRPSNEFYFYVILAPVGPFFKDGFNPTQAFVAEENVRATPGGTGEAKTGGNYAATLYETKKARELGYPMVIWLDSIERRYIEEGSGMNIMFVIDGEIYTPPLGGTILRGITRKSIIELASQKGIPVHEEHLDINTVIGKISNGSCSEAFFVGTAASITPIGKIYFKGTEYLVNNNEVGDVAQNLYDELVGIQTGKIEDTLKWTYKVV